MNGGTDSTVRRALVGPVLLEFSVDVVYLAGLLTKGFGTKGISRAVCPGPLLFHILLCHFVRSVVDHRAYK